MSIANEWRRRKGWSQLDNVRRTFSNSTDNTCILSFQWFRWLGQCTGPHVYGKYQFDSRSRYMCELNVSSWPCSEVLFRFPCSLRASLFGFPIFKKINLNFLIPIQSRVRGTVYIWVKRLFPCAILVKEWIYLLMAQKYTVRSLTLPA